MPTYEYRCKQCRTELEVVQSFTDDALTTCDACGGELRKVFGSVGISFKGSGFYKTDSRGGGANGASDTKSDTKTDGPSDTKSDTKTDGTSDAKSDTKSGAKADKKAATKAPAAASASS